MILNIIKVNNFKKIFREVSPQKRISVKMLSKKLYFFNEKLKQSEIPVIKDDFDKIIFNILKFYGSK